MKNDRILFVVYAFMAAVFYALNMPLSKRLLNFVPPTFMAAFLYLGAGIGVGIIYLFFDRTKQGNNLAKSDLPYVVGMVLLDIVAPILLMVGLTTASASSASLLNNFEIVATSLLALVLFRERISVWLWSGIFLITVSSILLTVEDLGALTFSGGALLVLAATYCWGLENNCTRQLSEKNTFQIVTIKGLCSGLGSLVIALIRGESVPAPLPVLSTLWLGFVAYGLSIFFYIRAQKGLGAAKTSAYYAVAPFVGAILSFVILGEPLSSHYFIALTVMVAGTIFVLVDTLLLRHQHSHTHVVTHTHDGSTHTHTFTHEHGHTHMVSDSNHSHQHTLDEIHRAST